MKNLISTLFLFSFISISVAKENSFFVGTKINNGKRVFAIKNENSNKTYRFKSYFLGNYLLFGGTIKNISISSGIGYNLYHYNNDNFIQDPIISFNRINNHIISIPFNIDYNINIYKQKLFVTTGIGIEYNLTVSIINKFEDYPDYKNKFKDLHKSTNLNSAIFTTKCGLLYSINKRIDLYSSFDFGFMVTKYLPPKNSTYEPAGKRYNYILSNSIGLNVKFGKNIKKKEKKESSEATKTTSYKTQQRFLLN